MLVQFGMSENAGQKMICQTRSINTKKMFAKYVGKVVRLTQNVGYSQLNHNKRDSQITRGKIAYSLIEPRPLSCTQARGYLLQQSRRGSKPEGLRYSFAYTTSEPASQGSFF